MNEIESIIYRKIGNAWHLVRGDLQIYYYEDEFREKTEAVAATIDECLRMAEKMARNKDSLRSLPIIHQQQREKNHRAYFRPMNNRDYDEEVQLEIENIGGAYFPDEKAIQATIRTGHKTIPPNSEIVIVYEPERIASRWE